MIIFLKIGRLFTLVLDGISQLGFHHVWPFLVGLACKMWNCLRLSDANLSVLSAKVTLHDFTFLKMEGLRWFVLIYFNYSLVHCADLKIGFLVDAFIFSVSRCSRHDLHRFWFPHDILEEVSFILHCQYWQTLAFEILDHLVVKCSTFGPHTCVSRSVSSFSSTNIQQTWSLLWRQLK